MKKILITGENSYIGISFEKWVKRYNKEYYVDRVSVRNESWKEVDFSKYDVVLHVAGIAHIKESKKNKELYFKVNCDLPNKVATKAKDAGVKQFIFISSMSVYGLKNGTIHKDTLPNPKSNYGKSKLQAEKLLSKLDDNNFKVVIIRPPMVYGKGCKGNYNRLSKLAKLTPVFPDIVNKRSMIYINNLAAFIKALIDDCCSGIYFPQNKEYVNTSDLVRKISEANNKKIYFIKYLNFLLKRSNINLFNKLFGDLTYDKDMSNYKREYNIILFTDSIRETEIKM